MVNISMKNYLMLCGLTEKSKISIVDVTPFSLIYCYEVVVPLELEIPSLHVSLDGYIMDKDKREMGLTHLEYLDDKRVNTLEYLRVHLYRIKRSYSQNIKPKEFKAKDLVLKENIANIKALENEKKGKFGPKWIVPYIVIENYGKGAYKLSTIEGKQERNFINAMHLK